MKNNLTGIIISALLHLGLLGWVISSEPIKKPVFLNNVALTVSMFQAEVIPAPTPIPSVIKKIEKPVKTPSPIKVAALAPTPKIKLKPSFVPAPAEKKKQKKSFKPAKTKTIAKLIKPKKKSKLVKKKSQPKKIKKTRKPVRRIAKRVQKKLRPRIVKKPVQHRSKKNPVQRRIVKRPATIKKKHVRKQHRVAVKTQPRQHAISPQNKTRVAKTTIQRKPTNKRYTQPKKARAKPTPRYTKPHKKQQTQYAKKNAPARHKTISKPKAAKRKVAAHASKSATLTRQYKARLQQLIAANKRYPKRAKRRGHQGSVTVSFRVTHSGNIVDIRIIKSANNNDLNRAAIKAIKQSSGKLAYTKGMGKKSLALTITLTYILS